MLSLLGILFATAWSYAQDKKGVNVKLDNIQSTAPAEWKAEKPQFGTRLHQFRLPKAEGDKEDAEVTVSYFGQGQGGGVNENVQRWKGQFVPPTGKSIDDVAKVEKMKVGDVEVTYLDVQGTYKSRNPPFDPNAKEELKPDSRMIAVYLATKTGPHFIRCVGPAKTVEQYKKGFDEWLKAFK
jgi:hypothetical protein